MDQTQTQALFLVFVVHQYYRQTKLQSYKLADKEALLKLGTQIIQNNENDQSTFQLKISKVMKQYFQKQVLHSVSSQQKLINDELYQFLQFIFSCFDKNIIERSYAFGFLEELCDCLSKEDLEKITRFFEIDLIQYHKIKDTTDNQIISAVLRIGNNLIKKFQKSFECQLRGQFRIALSKLIPFSHKSGVNQKSEINQQNMLTISKQSQNEIEKDMFNFNLFEKFWNVQQYLQNPVKIFEQDKHINQIFNTNQNNKQNLTVILNFCIQILKYFQKDRYQIKSLAEQNYVRNPKLMVNLQLFEQQLSNPQFKLDFIVQIYLFVFVLQNPINIQSVVKIRVTEEDVIIYTINILGCHCCLLLFKQQKLNQINQLINGLLSKIEQKDYFQKLKYLIEDEKFWQEWKEQSCYNLEKMAQKQEQSKPEPQKNEELVERIKNKLQIENQDDLVYNLDPQNVSISTEPFEPSIEYYFDQIFYGMESDNKSEDLDVYQSNNLYCWRALRVIQNFDLSLFSGSLSKMVQEESIIQFIAKKMKGREMSKESKQENKQNNDKSKQKSGQEEKKVESASKEDSRNVKEDRKVEYQKEEKKEYKRKTQNDDRPSKSVKK